MIRDDGNMVREISVHMENSLNSKLNKMETYVGFREIMQRNGIKEDSIILKAFGKIYSNKAYNVKKKKQINIFYTPALIKRESDIFKNMDIVNINMGEFKDVGERINDYLVKLGVKNSGDLTTEDVRPLIDKGILKMTFVDMPPVYYKFAIKNGTLVSDIYLKNLDCAILDPSSKFNSILDFINIGSLEIDLEMDKPGMLFTSIGEVGKISYKGKTKFVDIKSLDLDTRIELDTRFEMIMNDVHLTVAGYSSIFNSLWSIINISLKKKADHGHEVETIRKFREKSRDSSKNDKKRENEIKETNININLDIDSSGEEIKEIVSRELGIVEFVREEWLVRGHYRRLSSGEVIYIKPQVRKRDKSLLRKETLSLDKKEYTIN